MKNVEGNNSISLSRKIFVYLLSVVFLSVISIGLVWIENKLFSYQKDLGFLKNAFPRIKKSESKNRIPDDCEYITWIQYNPIDSIFQTAKIKYPGLC